MVTIRQYTAVDQFAFQALHSRFCLRLFSFWGPGLCLATSWTVWGSDPDGSKVSLLHTLPDQPWSPHSVLYDGYRGSFSGVKRPGRGVESPSPSTAKCTLSPRLYQHGMLREDHYLNYVLR
jgi:hypothetical protein